MWKGLAAMAFDGLGMLPRQPEPRFQPLETRSISAENFTGAKGQGGMATEGPAASSARELGQGWKVSPIHQHRPARDRHDRRDRGPRRDPAHLAHRPSDLVAPPGAPGLLGRRGDAIDRDPARRFLRQRLVRALQHHLAPDRRQPGRRLQQLLGDAIPQARPDHDRKPRPRKPCAVSTTR